MWQLVSGIFLGWSLGSNDAANVFGTAVASRMVRFWLAAGLCSIFVLVGALLEGSAGMATYRQMSPLGLNGAFIASLSAAVTVSMMSFLHLPVSTSQAVVGALVMMGWLRGSVHWASLGKVAICWVSTPVGAMFAAIVLYYVLGKLMNLLAPNLFMYDRGLRWLLIISGSYGAYALGANNVANVTGAFTGPGMLSDFTAALVGGLAIALGVMTYSKPVMMTVGKGLCKLDAFTAFIAILAEAVTVHVFAWIGVPVSTSQAVVGAVLGVGVVKSVRTINKKTLWKILFGWLGTPSVSAGISFVLYELFVLLKLLPGS